MTGNKTKQLSWGEVLWKIPFSLYLGMFLLWWGKQNKQRLAQATAQVRWINGRAIQGLWKIPANSSALVYQPDQTLDSPLSQSAALQAKQQLKLLQVSISLIVLLYLIFYYLFWPALPSFQGGPFRQYCFTSFNIFLASIQRHFPESMVQLSPSSRLRGTASLTAPKSLALSVHVQWTGGLTYCCKPQAQVIIYRRGVFLLLLSPVYLS